MLKDATSALIKKNPQSVTFDGQTANQFTISQVLIQKNIINSISDTTISR